MAVDYGSVVPPVAVVSRSRSRSRSRSHSRSELWQWLEKL